MIVYDVYGGVASMTVHVGDAQTAASSLEGDVTTGGTGSDVSSGEPHMGDGLAGGGERATCFSNKEGGKEGLVRAVGDMTVSGEPPGNQAPALDVPPLTWDELLSLPLSNEFDVLVREFARLNLDTACATVNRLAIRHTAHCTSSSVIELCEAPSSAKLGTGWVPFCVTQGCSRTASAVMRFDASLLSI